MSKNPLAKKLHIKTGYNMALINPPEGYTTLLEPLPDNVGVVHKLQDTYDLVHCFMTHQAELEAQLESLKTAMGENGILWVSYPKGGAKARVKTDVNRDRLARFMLDRGLKAVTQISIDPVWSALRFKKI